MCTFKNTGMYYFRAAFILTTISTSLIMTSCGSTDKNNRPSPAASDSTLIDGIKLTIDYSSPGVKKRKIWGELVPFGEVWRTGANKATVFETTGDILINNQHLEAGKYSYFTITSDSAWTIVFNQEWDQWGAYNYDESKDALRLNVKPQKSDYTERMTFTFSEKALRFEWENLGYKLKIN